jgi:hypothetical protein
MHFPKVVEDPSPKFGIFPARIAIFELLVDGSIEKRIQFFGVTFGLFPLA